MRRFLLASVLAVLPLCALAHDPPPAAGRQQVTLVAGLGSLHHPVTTDSPLAQRFFDQGMRYLFAFNHAEAVRSFERAAELDPPLAMVHWGHCTGARAQHQRADERRARCAGAKPGLYTMGYASHNMHFLAIGEAVAGRCTSARRAAAQLVRHVEPAAKGNPDLDPFVPTAMLIDARCGRWSDVVAVAEPAFELPQTDIAWRFVRGMAFARWGKPAHAQAELHAPRAALASLPKDAANGNNVARDVFRVADAQLAAAIARARGDRAAEIAELGKAIAANDALVYDEPPSWYLPPRETRGAALFLQGDFAGAEAVFRADLERNRMSGRALWGLAQSLQAQGKTAEATAVRMSFRKAWHNADVRLAMEEL